MIKLTNQQHKGLLYSLVIFIIKTKIFVLPDWILTSRLTSQVWSLYDESRGDDRVKLGTCRLCELSKVLRCPGNSTGVLWKHAEKFHKEDLNSLKKMTDKLRGIKKTTSSSQPTILGAFSSQAKLPYGPNHPKQREFDKNLVNEFINDLTPLCIPNTPSLQGVSPKLPAMRGSFTQTPSCEREFHQTPCYEREFQQMHI